MVVINLTPNIQLKKPTSDELYDVQIQNQNMDVIDTKIKALQDTDVSLATKNELQTHQNNISNPHNVTKNQVGLGNVANTRQIDMVTSEVGSGNVPVFNGITGYTLRDSGHTIEKSIPADAVFTDTVYTHPDSGVEMGDYTKVFVDSKGHVIYGSNPTTLAGYGIIDADPLGSATSALVESKDYADSTYTQATGYTDNKVAKLINGAPSTLDTLKEIADAMEENQTIVEALETAVGSKANEVEFQAHQNNTIVHVTASERTGWNEKAELEDIPAIVDNLTTVITGNALDAVQGKVLDDKITANETPQTFITVTLSALNTTYDINTTSGKWVYIEVIGTLSGVQIIETISIRIDALTNVSKTYVRYVHHGTSNEFIRVAFQLSKTQISYGASTSANTTIQNVTAYVTN